MAAVNRPPSTVHQIIIKKPVRLELDGLFGFGNCGKIVSVFTCAGLCRVLLHIIEAYSTVSVLLFRLLRTKALPSTAACTVV